MPALSKGQMGSGAGDAILTAGVVTARTMAEFDHRLRCHAPIGETRQWDQRQPTKPDVTVSKLLH